MSAHREQHHASGDTALIPGGVQRVSMDTYDRASVEGTTWPALSWQELCTEQTTRWHKACLTHQAASCSRPMHGDDTCPLPEPQETMQPGPRHRGLHVSAACVPVRDACADCSTPCSG